MKIIVITLLSSVVLYSQQKHCGTTEFMNIKLQDSIFASQFYKRQNEINNKISSKNKFQLSNELMIVPVAFHFPTGNESDRACLIALAQEQIDVLNADFNANNADISLWYNQASQFYPGVQPGSLNVFFCLATQNHPQNIDSDLLEGEPAVTIGYIFGGQIGHITDSSWSGYLNVVVGPCDTLGYSSLGARPIYGDAVYINYHSIGAGITCGIIPNDYNGALGRTGTHEVGHYFNLLHSFASCTCDSYSTDIVADTPQSNCISGWDPPFGTIPGCNPSEKVLTMNYMDYQPDHAQFLFTRGQMMRSRTYLETIFSQYKTNFGSCNALDIPHHENKEIYIYPNPSKGIINIKIPFINEKKITVLLTNMLGMKIYEKDFLTPNSQFFEQISFPKLESSIYILTIQDGIKMYSKEIIFE